VPTCCSSVPGRYCSNGALLQFTAGPRGARRVPASAVTTPDDYQVTQLDPDAVPVLLSGLHEVSSADDEVLWRTIGNGPAGRSSATAYNLARADAARAIKNTCRGTGP
jgi:hypothetical protein